MSIAHYTLLGVATLYAFMGAVYLTEKDWEGAAWSGALVAVTLIGALI